MEPTEQSTKMGQSSVSYGPRLYLIYIHSDYLEIIANSLDKYALTARSKHKTRFQLSVLR